MCFDGAAERKKTGRNSFTIRTEQQRERGREREIVKDRERNNKLIKLKDELNADVQASMQKPSHRVSTQCGLAIGWLVGQSRDYTQHQNCLCYTSILNKGSTWRLEATVGLFHTTSMC